MRAFLLAFPAYGVTYKTHEEMKAAFLQGRDFSVSTAGGPYFSVRDFLARKSHMDHFTGVVLAQKGLDGHSVLTRVEMMRNGD